MAAEQNEAQARYLAATEFNRCMNEPNPWNCPTYGQELASIRDAFQNGSMRFARSEPDGESIAYIVAALISGAIALAQLLRRHHAQ